MQSGKQPVEPRNASVSGQSAAASSNAPQEKPFLISAPSISLPKGGGAIRGMGEKFAANPVTGTGSMTVPLPISPGRGGFQPQLTLQYDSGVCNGPFGLGWRLSLPSISRKTDKGLPRYRDHDESDVFLLAGAEDLVPGPYDDRDRGPGPSIVRLAGQRYELRRYQPRVEGLFARIERWSSLATPSESFWRVIDRTNVTQWYGRTPESRIADPEDSTRIFEWLPCEHYDDKGNVITYHYKADDAEAIDVSRPWEIHRLTGQRNAQRYIKRVRYGNRTPYFPSLHPDEPTEPLPSEWLFELVFDYGDHDDASPTSVPDQIWTARPDPFSNYRPGFEVRTSRRCNRVLMFHHIPESLDLGTTGLVRSMRFGYDDAAADDPSQPGYSTLRAIETRAHQDRGDGRLEQRQTPPLEFTYSRAHIDTEIRTLAADALEGLPVGTQGPCTQWIDLDGEGLSGVLSEEAGTWRYASNLGEGRFGPSCVVATVPANRSLASGPQRLMDVDGNGRLELVDDARVRNLIGQAIVHDDPAGRMDLRRRNFSGQAQDEERRFAKHRTARVIDWQGDDAARESQLEAETFTRLTEHDALGRMTLLINWHRRADRVAVYRPVYNARGVLEAEDLTIGAQLEEGRPRGGCSRRAVHGMTYNAKGQRTRLRQGNGTETRYAHDPRSFRLTQLRTTRPATDLPFPTFRSNLRDERVVQQLHYT